MTETFNEGDLIEASKGEAIYRDRLAAALKGRLHFPEFQGGAYVETLIDEGWLLTLIAKATPALPTEPGTYALMFPLGEHAYTLTDGSWWDGSDGIPAAEMASRLKEADVPFVRLEPVAGTAKKVLDRVRAEVLDVTFRESSTGMQIIYVSDVTSDLKNVATEFGVTS